MCLQASQCPYLSPSLQGGIGPLTQASESLIPWASQAEVNAAEEKYSPKSLGWVRTGAPESYAFYPGPGWDPKERRSQYPQDGKPYTLACTEPQLFLCSVGAALLCGCRGEANRRRLPAASLWGPFKVPSDMARGRAQLLEP